LSRPIKAGLVIFLLLVAGAMAGGLVRVGRHLEDPPSGSNCPLEENP
jgi:hypothetical protein